MSSGKDGKEDAGMEPKSEVSYRFSRRVGGIFHVRGRKKEGWFHLGFFHALNDGDLSFERGEVAVTIY